MSEHQDIEDEKPPILGSWRRIYALVLIAALFYILLFSLLTYIYS